MSILLVVGSIIALLIGFLSLSEATFGVGFIGVACLLGIWARLAQADAAKREILERLEALDRRARNGPLESKRASATASSRTSFEMDDDAKSVLDEWEASR